MKKRSQLKDHFWNSVRNRLWHEYDTSELRSELRQHLQVQLTLNDQRHQWHALSNELRWRLKYEQT